MVGAVGQGGDPLAVSLGLLFPRETEEKVTGSEQGLDSALRSLLMFSAHYCAPAIPLGPVEDVFLAPTGACVRRAQKYQIQNREQWGSLSSQLPARGR